MYKFLSGLKHCRKEKRRIPDDITENQRKRKLCSVLPVLSFRTATYNLIDHFSLEKQNWQCDPIKDGK